MKKDPLIFIEHILECIQLIKKYTKTKTIGAFFSSQQLQDSVIRRIEIIGEAIKNLPEQAKKDHPEIPWKQIAGMRDMLVHEYFGVDLSLTWKVVKQDIPELEKNIIKLKKSLKGDAKREMNA